MTWLTARLLTLPGLPGTERARREWLEAHQVPSRKRAGKGGGLEYDCSALPPAMQQAVLARQIAAATPAIAAHTEVQAEPLATTTALPLVPAAPAPTLAARTPPNQVDKACADARLLLVNQLLDLAQAHGTSRASQVLALQLASGECGPELAEVARLANQRARSSAVSARTLYRYLATYQAQGWWGLLPAAPVAAPLEFDQDVAAVLGSYHSRNPLFRNLSRAAIEVTKQLGRPYDSWKALYSRAARALKKVDRVDLIKARHSGAQRAAQLPFKRRDTSVLKPLDVALIDGHTFKAKVRHPEHGAPFAPEVTLMIDAATRKATGWSVALSENVMAVGDALRHSVGRFGVPAIIYSDNGAGETAKQMDCPVVGIVARLGAEHRTGLPGHPQGHGLIERSWQTHMITCARQFGSYQGSGVDDASLRKVSALLASEQRALKRASATGEVVKLSAKAPTWRQFMDAVAAAVDEYNSCHRHRSLPKHTHGPLAGKHMTPDEAWAAMLDVSLQHLPSPQELRMLFMPALLRTAVRGEVTFLNQRYQHRELMAVDGQQVRVHYDIHDPAYVLVFDSQGEYICEAKWNANRMDFFPKPVVEMAREKRVRSAVKRLDDKRELAMRELGRTLDSGNVFQLSAPGTPMTLDVPGPLQAPMQAGLAQAGQGRPLQAVPPLATPAHQRPAMFDTDSDRYEWLQLHLADWAQGDAAWVERYARSEGYEALADYYEGRGLAWKGNDEMGFKGAR